jgi:hypothetical protein
VSFEVLASGAHAAQEAPLSAVARSRKELEAIWERVAATQIPKPEMPLVEFDSQVVIAVFLGERPTGGYSLTVDAVCRPDGAAETPAAAGDRAAKAPGKDAAADRKLPADGVHVCYTEYRPREDALLTMAVTSPYVLLVVDRPVAEVLVHHRTIVGEAGS